MMRKLSKETKDKNVCLGCGWTGSITELSEYGTCPVCKYENGAPPYRLLTLGEILDSDEEASYMNVRLDLFLKTVFHLLSIDEVTK